MTPPERKHAVARKALRRLRELNTSALETTGGSPPDLRDIRIKSSIDIARARFRKISERAAVPGQQLADAQKKVLEDAEAALKRLASDGDTAEVTQDQEIALEAIIVADGTRPALFVQDEDVDPTAEQTGAWQAQIAALRPGIAKVASSVGRIDSQIGFPNYAGTGFVVADGLILTNRHVLEALVGGPDPQLDGTWKFLQPASIDFAGEFERERKKSFKITGVAFASPDRIRRQLVLSNLDVALLKVETHNGSESLPAPLALSRRMGAVNVDAQVYAIGYPGRPFNEVAEVLMQVFQDEYFVKRFAPGYVDRSPDDVSDGGHKRVFTHDASTLGGNSGSCLIEFSGEGRDVVGLHFGGIARTENYSHSLARLERVFADNGVQVEYR